MLDSNFIYSCGGDIEWQGNTAVISFASENILSHGLRCTTCKMPLSYAGETKELQYFDLDSNSNMVRIRMYIPIYGCQTGTRNHSVPHPAIILYYKSLDIQHGCTSDLRKSLIKQYYTGCDTISTLAGKYSISSSTVRLILVEEETKNWLKEKIGKVLKKRAKTFCDKRIYCIKYTQHNISATLFYAELSPSEKEKCRSENYILCARTQENAPPNIVNTFECDDPSDLPDQIPEGLASHIEMMQSYENSQYWLERYLCKTLLTGTPWSEVTAIFTGLLSRAAQNSLQHPKTSVSPTATSINSVLVPLICFLLSPIISATLIFRMLKRMAYKWQHPRLTPVLLSILGFLMSLMWIPVETPLQSFFMVLLDLDASALVFYVLEHPWIHWGRSKHYI